MGSNSASEEGAERTAEAAEVEGPREGELLSSSPVVLVLLNWDKNGADSCDNKLISGDSAGVKGV